ncbi:MAG: aspartate-semialdehyde dehydrogenase [Bacteroidales bacterium]|nr:aspartate-semialdehyde dehydrogenase [Bacteroidales bacterium]
MKIAVVGATGLVGSVMLKVLEERDFPLKELIPVASQKSVGKTVFFKGKEFKIVGLQEAVELKPEIAIFSAGGQISLDWAEKFAKNGTVVIDNSSAWRMDNSKKLVVPEINAHLLSNNDKIIANPNCSTIQMVTALALVHKNYGIKRLVISTYQSVTGTGVPGVNQLSGERKGLKVAKVYPHQIDLNVIPHGGSFDSDGYTSEETKLVNETRKILSDQKIRITSTVVRVPVFGGHSVSVNMELNKNCSLADFRKTLENTQGVVIQDNPEKNLYPMPLYSEGKDEVFVGRIRQDFSNDNSFNLWIVADNLRKGAATNAIQIAEYLVEKGLVCKYK